MAGDSQYCFTTVIPTYNRARLAARAVRSALHQTHPDVRVLVCDNASTDDTESVIRELARRDDRVRYHRQPENVGPIRNFQAGMALADTSHFSFLSDDDLLLPDYYARAAAALRAHPRARFYCGQAITFNATAGTHSLHPRRFWSSGFHEGARWAPAMFSAGFPWMSCVFSREVPDTIGPLDSLPIMDILWLVRAAAALPFVVDLEPAAIFSLGGETVGSTLSFRQVRADFTGSLALADAPTGTNADREALRAAVHMFFVFRAHALLRTAFMSGNRRRVGEVAAFLARLGALDTRRRLLTALFRSGPAGAAAVGLFTRVQGHYRTLKRGGGTPLTLAQLLAMHAPPDFCRRVLEDEPPSPAPRTHTATHDRPLDTPAPVGQGSAP